MSDAVLIIDDDRPIDEVLGNTLSAAGLLVETVDDGFVAIEKLRHQRYSAVILDPMIRHRLNGYAVLSFIELEQPETLPHLFLLTGMSEQTIARTAPRVLPRLFRKPVEASRVAAAVLASADRLEQRRLPARSILIVEDDRVTAATLASLVRELGYEPTVAESGREAMKHLEAGDYAAILLDLVLPDLDGFAVLEHLQATKPKLLRRMIITTGMPEKYTAEIDRNRVCGVMHKPVETVQLTALLQRCAGSDMR